MHLLFVCTGNMCRSPVAERLAVSTAERFLGAEAAGLDIASAGVEAQDGKHMDPHSAEALMRLGGHSAGFRTRRFTASMAEGADLVLTMTRSHRRSVLAAAPRGLRRTFTLLEAADLLRRADVTGLPDLSSSDRARQLGLRLDAVRAGRAASDADDILDPIGRPARVHQAVASTIADALTPLATTLFGASTEEDPASESAGTPLLKKP